MRKGTPMLALLALLCAAPASAQQSPAGQAAPQRIAFRSELPRTLVFIQEKDGNTAARELMTFLSEAGFPLIDPALAHTAAQRELVQAALAGDEGAAVQLGRDFGAQVLILGSAEWGVAPNPVENLGMVGTADVSLRAIRLDGGKQVGAPQRVDVTDYDAGTEQAARNRALRSAVQQLLGTTEFVGAIANHWIEVPWSPTDYFKPDPGSVGEALGGRAAGSTPRLAIVRTDVLPPIDAATRGIGVVRRAERGSTVKNDVDIEGVVTGQAASVEVEGTRALLSPLDDATRYQLGLGPDAQRFRARIALPQAQDTVRVVATSPAGERVTALAAPRVGERWAVIVGVGDYQSADIVDLAYAARDAEAVYDFLRSPEAGPFPEDHILFLRDGQATNQAIREALFVFLQQAKWNDLVVIYFAGHGAPDPNLPDNLYLLPADARLDALAATAFPMWDVKTALRRQIRAERVIVIADACHSGGAGERGGTGAAAANPVSGAFAELFSPSRRLTLTAAAENELSLEHERWGGGHGVFTFSILEALQGSGDLDGNGIVTFGEVADYVARRVKAETGGRQNPQRTGLGDIPLAEVKAGTATRPND